MSAYSISAEVLIDTSQFTKGIDAAIAKITSFQTSFSDMIQGSVVDSEKLSAAVDQQAASVSSSLHRTTQANDEIVESARRQSDSVDSASRSWSEFGSQSVKSSRSALQSIGDTTKITGTLLGFFAKMAKMPGLNIVASTLKTIGFAGQLAGKHYDETAKQAEKNARAHERMAAATRTANTATAASSAAQKNVKSSTSSSVNGLQLIRDKALDAASSNEQLKRSIERVGGNPAAAAAVISATKEIADQSKSASKSLRDLAGVMGGRALFAVVMYKAGVDEAIQASAKWVSSDSKLVQSSKAVLVSVSELVTNGVDRFSAGIKASFVSLLEWSTGFGSITELVDAGGQVLTNWAKAAEDATKGAGDFMNEVSLNFSANVEQMRNKFRELVGLKPDSFNREAFLEEGRALNKMAEETERVNKKQLETKAAFDIIKKSIADVTASREHAAAMAKVSSLKTVEAVEAEMRKLRELTAETNGANAQSATGKKQLAEQAAALQKQLQSIQDGSSNGQVESIMTSLDEQLNKLRMGADGAVIAAARAKNATEEEIKAIYEKQNQISALEIAQKSQKDAQEAANRTAEKQKQAWENGAEKIAKMRDEVAVLNKTMTKYEALSNELKRSDFAEDQVKEIVELQKQLDELNGKKKEGDKARDNDAALAGSSKAAEIMLRGVSGASKSKTEKLQQDSNELQKQILAATKSNKPSDTNLVMGVFNA